MKRCTGVDLLDLFGVGEPIHFLKSKYNNIHIWLPTKKLLDEFDDDYLSKHDNNIINDIIKKIYGNLKDFVYHIINEGKENDIKAVFEILKQAKVDYDEHKLLSTETDENINEIKDEKNDDNIEIISTSYFDKLSTSSITNICSYLNRIDINKFKLVSSTIAIQCLLEMKKYNDIGIFNMNQLHYYYKYKHMPYLNTYYANQLYTFDRYNTSIRFNFQMLMQNISSQYNIPIEYILIKHCQIHKNVSKAISFISFIETYDHSNYDPFQMSSFSYSPKNSCYYTLLFDTRNIINVSMNGHIINKRLNANQLKNDYLFVLLYYFDIKNQTIPFSYSLFVHKQATGATIKFFIDQYIKLLLQNVLNENDIKEISDIIKHSKIKLYTKPIGPAQYHKLKSKEALFNNETIIFQINNNEYINKCKKYFQFDSFYTNPNKLERDTLKRLQLKQQHLSDIEYDYEKLKYFDRLSVINFESICSYLNKSDISKLKCVNCFISIICLKYMKQLPVKTINIQTIIESKQFNNLTSFQNSNTHLNIFSSAVNIHRFNASIVDSLYDIWYEYYGIKKQNILIFETVLDSVKDMKYISNLKKCVSALNATNKSNAEVFGSFDPFADLFTNPVSQSNTITDADDWGDFGDFDSEVNTNISIRILKQTEENTKNIVMNEGKVLLLFDKSQMFSINNYVSNLVIDEFSNIIFLYYFDIQKQIVRFTKIFVGHKANTIQYLYNFIERNLKIFEDTYLLEQVQKMKESKHIDNIIKIFECSGYFNEYGFNDSLILNEHKMNETIAQDTFQIYLFQLNVDHFIFNNNKLLYSYLYAYDLLFDNDSNHKMRQDIKLKYKNDNVSLLQCIEYLNDNDEKKEESKNNNKFDLTDFFVMSSICSNTQIISLKKQIMNQLKLFSTTMCIDYIHIYCDDILFKNNQNMMQIKSLSSTKESNESDMYFQIFDDKKIKFIENINENVKLININIYEPNLNDTPELNTILTKKLVLTSIPSKTQFTFNEFIDYLCFIGNENGMYSDKLNGIIDKYFQKNGKYSFIIAVKNEHYFENNDIDIVLDMNSKSELDLFIINIENDNEIENKENEYEDKENENILLWVRYIDGIRMKFIKDEGNSDYKGRPQKLLIAKKDIIDDIKIKCMENTSINEIKFRTKSGYDLANYTYIYDKLYADGIQTEMLFVHIL